MGRQHLNKSHEPDPAAMILGWRTSAFRSMKQRRVRLLSCTAMGAVEQFLIHGTRRIHHERS